MKRKLVLLGSILFVVVLLFGLIKFITGRSPKTGELRVDANPAASVFLDNKHIGRTPYRDKVASGQYTLKIVPESTIQQYATWQGNIVVGPNLLTFINATLSDSELTSAVDVLWLEKISSKQSELAATTNPDGATLIIDDQTRGVTPITISDLSAGDHTIVISSPGFVTRTLKVKTTPGYKLIVSLKLALAPGTTPVASASPTLQTSPTTTGTPSLTPTKIATSSASVPNPAKPYVIIKDTPTGFLRVRMEPSTSATEAGQVKPGEKYHIEDEENGWYQIIYQPPNKGWISGQYAEKVE